MLDLLKTNSELDDTTMAVNQRPSVLEARRALDDARVPYDKAKAHLDMIEKTLAPSTSSSTSLAEPADEIGMIRARAVLPQAQQAYWEAEAVLKGEERKFQRAVEAERRNVTEERADPRRPLVKELFALLDVAVAMAEQIQAYDDETRRLGGISPHPPITELLSDSYRQNFVEGNRFVLKKEGWL